jgi:nitrate reductase NapE component
MAEIELIPPSSEKRKDRHSVIADFIAVVFFVWLLAIATAGTFGFVANTQFALYCIAGCGIGMVVTLTIAYLAG